MISNCALAIRGILLSNLSCIPQLYGQDFCTVAFAVCLFLILRIDFIHCKIKYCNFIKPVLEDNSLPLLLLSKM